LAFPEEINGAENAVVLAGNWFQVDISQAQLPEEIAESWHQDRQT
jgi:hypothetical protein